MDISFLGTGGGVGLPNPFCQCEHCEEVRQAGGKSLRNSPAVLINNDLLIDCGSDVYPGARRMGVRLDSVWLLVITHSHSDHLDPWFFWARRGTTDTELSPLTVYAPQDTLDFVFAFYREKKGWNRATFERETHTLCRPVRGGSVKLAQQYRLHFFPASHGGGKIEAVMVGVSNASGSYLHAYDTGPFSDTAWNLLRRHHFDAVALDATIGPQLGYDSLDHMTFAQTVEHARRMREEGILKKGGTILATHFVHQASGTHESLVDLYTPQEIAVAYDGLTLSLGNHAPLPPPIQADEDQPAAPS